MAKGLATISPKCLCGPAEGREKTPAVHFAAGVSHHRGGYPSIDYQLEPPNQIELAWDHPRGVSRVGIAPIGIVASVGIAAGRRGVATVCRL
jgi:hypothetical protein